MWPSILDVRTRVRRRLNESTAAFWTDEQLNRLIQAGAMDVSAKTLCIENKDSATTTPASRSVDYTGFKVNFVEYVPASGAPVGLPRILPHQLGRLPYGGTQPQYWCPWGSAVLIDPTPAAAHTLNLYVADYPVLTLIEDGNTLDQFGLPIEAYELVVDYATIYALLKDRKFATAGRMYADYINNIMKCRILFMQRRADTRADIVIPERLEYRRAGREE
jgi:hypothetical protein